MPADEAQILTLLCCPCSIGRMHLRSRLMANLAEARRGAVVKTIQSHPELTLEELREMGDVCSVANEIKIGELASRAGGTGGRATLDKALLACEQVCRQLHRSRVMTQACRSIVEHYGLTAAQARVLPPLASCYEDEEIAQVLDLSRDTVHSHMRAIFQKIGLNSRKDIVKMFVGKVDSLLASRRFEGGGGE
jgi:DNA-binding CsgD family transcriptional regulator